MKPSRKLLTYKRFALTSALGLSLLAPLASAVDIIDEFNGNALDENAWFAHGGKDLATVSGGRVNWTDSGGNWADGEIESKQRLVLPPAGETTTITWELAPATVTTDNGGDPNANSFRCQFGIFSHNEPANFDEFGDPAPSITRREQWNNTTGGTFYDITEFRSGRTDAVAGGLFDTNDTKTDASQGNQIAYPTIAGWNWLTESRAIRVELTETDYTWYDGDNVLGSNTWIDAGIDTEFSNGFRIAAMTMNFDAGRGAGGYERIAVENAFLPSPLIDEFRLQRSSVVAGQANQINWTVAPGSTVTIEPDIGNVDAQTDAEGRGALIFIPVEGDIPGETKITYTLTVQNGTDTLTTATAVTVEPRPTPNTSDFIDEFDEGSLNPNVWETRGGKTHTVEEGYLKWADDDGNWGRHEINTVQSFPIPPIGNTTIIKWNLGPASITTENTSSTQSARNQIGIISYHERAGGSRETWNNTTGGIYLDLFFRAENETGIDGGVMWNDDQKPNANQYPWRGGVSVADWNWQTEDHEFSLEITTFGYTWYSGQDLIYSGTWAADNLDNEWSNGFRVYAVGMNYDTGRGATSVQSITVDNGGEIPTFDIISAAKGPGGVALTWESTPDEASVYNIERAPDLDGAWTPIAQDIASTGDTTSFTDPTPPAGDAFYRIVRRPPPPLYFAGFEAGEDLTGWTEIVDNGSTQWEVGPPTSGPGSANSGDNVYATKLGADYDNDLTVFLQSPEIDITGRENVTVQFFQWFDFEYLAVEDLETDWGEVTVVDDTGFPLLTAPIRAARSSGGWVQATLVLPDGLADKIRIEFALFTDAIGQRPGWFIDDVTVR